MKKIKLLTGLATLSSLGMIVMPLTSCSKKKEVEATVSSIEITTQPTKTTYNTGETLDLTGTVVKANYSNGSTKELTASEYTTSIAVGTMLIPANNKVVVTHTVSGKTAEFNITVSPIDFLKCSWATISNACDALEQGKITSEQFCTIFLNGTEPITTMDGFVGLERAVKINELNHIVRVIGVQHDTIAGTNTKAALTFELVTLLSESSGSRKISKWDASLNYDYTNSILRKNLNGVGSASGSDVWDKPALDMLHSEVKSAIKEVEKEVAINSAKTKGSQNYVVTKYSDKLFPLTYAEMSQPEGWYVKEGTQYKYWVDHDTDAARVKKDIGGSNLPGYWLSSPRYYSDVNNRACLVCGGSSVGGLIDSDPVNDNSRGVSFAFCI